MLSRWLRRRAASARLNMPHSTVVPEGGVLVGGAVRDLLLDRTPNDLDWLVTEPERAAREAAEALGGSAFPLDDARGHWRTIADEVSYDYAPMRGSLEADLDARDFTLNAVALRPDGTLIDPHRGADDLQRRRLRMVARANLDADPLRTLRGVRLMTTLNLEAEPATEEALREVALALAAGALPLPAWERSAAELTAMLTHPRAAWGLTRLESLGLMTTLLPELAAGRGVAQGGFHHLDVLDHSLAALAALIELFPDADTALRWGALLHDVGKPDTAELGEDGRTRFYGHDRLGAELTQRALTRLRQPVALIARASALVRAHMLPLPKGEREARRFAHRRRTLLPDLLWLMIADREAARGPLSSPGSRRAYRIALSRIVAILGEAPERPPLLDGREVMALLDLPPGPQVGEALRFLREAEAVGDIGNDREAVEALRGYARAQGWQRT
jgi:poly(A) polymerase